MLSLYNTMTRQKQEFTPLAPPFVGMYVCGPTVYGHSHLGHGKSYVSFDVLLRYLRYLDYKVRYVQNITDVGHLTDDADSGEDKLQKQAKLEKLEPMEIAEKYTASYFRDMDRSGWFHRYGVYMWAFSILITFQLYRNILEKQRIPAVILLLVLSADYLSGYTKITYASGNIYQQQYQMRRFVHGWLQEPVAVNDLGLVSMGYDEYVLDLWGLATPAALQGASDPAWVDSVAAVNGVNYAIVYRDEIDHFL